jgi:hypothetical protein
MTSVCLLENIGTVQAVLPLSGQIYAIQNKTP